MSIFGPIITLISKDQMCVIKGKEINCFPINNAKWTEENLNTSIIELKKLTKNHPIDIIVDDSLSYITEIVVPIKTSIKEIKERAQRFIPEMFNDGYWDWKQIHRDKNTKKIQVFVANQARINKLIERFLFHKVKVETIKPISYVITQAIEPNQPSLIIFTLSNYVLAIIGRSKHVIWTEVIKNTNNFENELKRLVDFSQKNFSLEIKKIIFTNQELSKQFEKNDQSWDIQFKDINLEHSPAINERKKGSEEDSCLIDANNLWERKKEKESFDALDEKEQEKSRKNQEIKKKIIKIKEQKKSLFLIFIALFLFTASGLILGFYFYQKSNDEKNTEPPINPEDQIVVQPTSIPITLAPTITPIPKSTIIDDSKNASESTKTTEITKISIEILNGSGIPGEASKISDILTEENFENIKLGNADSYDFKETMIYGQNKEYLEKISLLLGKTHKVKIEIKNISDKKTDVLIVAGTQKSL